MPNNHMLARLTRAERRAFQALCLPVALAPGDWLSGSRAINQRLFFPDKSCVSLLTQMDAHAALEVGMVGREGYVGAHLVLDSGAPPVHALVQSEGRAWSLAARQLPEAFNASPTLHGLLHRFLSVQLAHWARASACQRFHQLRPRLARWLLMRADRSEGEPFAMTHEVLANLLGVRRVGVTVAASALQRAGLIHYHRGQIAVCNREGLEAIACSCYRADLAVYRDGMLGLAPGHRP